MQLKYENSSSFILVKLNLMFFWTFLDNYN